MSQKLKMEIRGFLQSTLVCKGKDESESEASPKGVMPIVVMPFIAAITIVNGLFCMQDFGGRVDDAQLQETVDEIIGNGHKVSNYSVIFCDSFDESKEETERMSTTIRKIKQEYGALEYLSVANAQRCAECLLGVVTVDGSGRQRFAPLPFDGRSVPDQMRLMQVDETYDDMFKTVEPKVNEELLQFGKEIGNAPVCVVKYAYPAAMALTSGKAVMKDFGSGVLTQAELQRELDNVVPNESSFKQEPVTEWRVVVSEPIGESLNREQLEVIAEVFNAVHSMSLSVAEAERVGDCVVGVVHGDCLQFRKFNEPIPLSQFRKFASLVQL